MAVSVTLGWRKKQIRINDILPLPRSPVLEICGLNDLIYLKILTWIVFFMCVHYDSILANVDVPIIIKIYDHVWNNILPLSIRIVIFHGFQIQILELIFKFRVWVCFDSTWKHIWAFWAVMDDRIIASHPVNIPVRNFVMVPTKCLDSPPMISTKIGEVWYISVRG